MATRLRLAYRTFDGFERALTTQIAHFRATHPDVEVEICDFDVPQLYSEMVAGPGCRSGDWDLFLALTDWLPQLMRDGSLHPLNDRLQQEPPPGWPDGWSTSVTGLQADSGGNLYGIPYHDGPELFMYRADLFESPTEREAFRNQYGYELRPPETWSQFRDIAIFFTRPQDDMYGCVLAAEPDGHNSVYDFFIHLWSRGGVILDGRKAVFNRPVGREALQFLTDLINKDRVTQPNARAYESVRSGEYYASGRAAMMWNWMGFAVVADLPPSRIVGQNRCGLIPRGDGPAGRHTSLSVYWVLGIPAGSHNADLAWQFMISTASREMDKVTATSGAIGCRLSTWRDADIQHRFPSYRLVEDVHREVETLPALPEYPMINEVLNEIIDEVHTGQRPVDEALDEAAAQVNHILAR